MKIASTIFLLVFLGLTVANAVWQDTDPLGFTGLVIGLTILGVLWGILIWGSSGKFSSFVSGTTMLLCAMLVVGSGGPALSRILGRSAVQVNVDNSVDVYPMPDPETEPEGFSLWFKEKTVIEPNEGAEKVGFTAWIASATALWLVTGITWLMAKLKIPWLKPIAIPVQVMFLIIWTILSIYLISSPVNTHDMDATTSRAMSLQWTLGFTRNLWWAWATTAISWVLSKLTPSPYSDKSHGIALFFSGVTWIAFQIFQATVDPTTVAWTMCTRQVFETSLTMALCQEAFVAGKISALAVSMAWAWLISFLGD